MPARQIVRAWRPSIPGIVEVFHAHFTEHAYPMHAHDSWALLIIDDGAVRYDLDRHERGALTDLVTLLPPHVPHNGRSATPQGFRKRVIYLDIDALDNDLIGPSVDTPAIADAVLRQRIDRLHLAMAQPGDEFEAESRLTLILDRLRWHHGAQVPAGTALASSLASDIRDLLDSHVVAGLTLHQTAAIVRSHPTHVVRAFSSRFGMAPHQYLISRRVDLARTMLLAGQPAHAVAVDAGFYDQSHLNRHFKRIVGTSPGRYVRP